MKFVLVNKKEIRVKVFVSLLLTLTDGSILDQSQIISVRVRFLSWTILFVLFCFGSRCCAGGVWETSSMYCVISSSDSNSV